MTIDNFRDDRNDTQETLDVGEAADRTKHRDGKIAGSENFADEREEPRDSGEQSQLFVDADENQQTLTGESAANQCLFTEE